jgi:6-pyruvoyltetrahydropterin/6-carboxytetrahydropterin synthase
VFELSIRTHFSGAHRLKGYPGQCADLHGHNWSVEVFVRGPKLDGIGVQVKAVMDELDHKNLCDLKAFRKINPSSENIAKFIFARVAARLDCKAYKVSRVTVGETPESSASYWE